MKVPAISERQIHLRLPAELYDRLLVLAQRADRTLPGEVRRAVRRYLVEEERDRKRQP